MFIIGKYPPHFKIVIIKIFDHEKMLTMLVVIVGLMRRMTFICPLVALTYPHVSVLPTLSVKRYAVKAREFNVVDRAGVDTDHFDSVFFSIRERLHTTVFAEQML